jgi:hypothetical protein
MPASTMAQIVAASTFRARTRLRTAALRASASADQAPCFRALVLPGGAPAFACRRGKLGFAWRRGKPGFAWRRGKLALHASAR